MAGRRKAEALFAPSLPSQGRLKRTEELSSQGRVKRTEELRLKSSCGREELLRGCWLLSDGHSRRQLLLK